MPTISTKDHHYLKDQLSWELLAMKKYSALATQCQDQQMGQILDQIGKAHQGHYEKILKFLNTH